MISLIPPMELVVETLQLCQLPLQLLLRQDQCGDSEVMGAFPLLESTSWNQDNPCVLQDLQAIEFVNWPVTGSLDGLLRKPDLRKCAHRPLRLTRTYIVHVVQSSADESSPML